MNAQASEGRTRRTRYPVVGGKIRNEACEINVAEHCNLRCRGCSHLAPVLPRNFVDPDEVLRDLRILARHYRADHVRLLGGEPLLHPDLHAVADAVRVSGITDRIRVLTNGTLLARMAGAFWRAVDEVHISTYPGHELPARELDACQQRASQAGVVLVVKHFDDFRESYSELGTHNNDTIRRIYHTCQIAHVWRCHNVSGGYFYKCPQSIFLSRVLGNGAGTDGVALTDTADLGDRLLAYLSDDQPLRACANCLGSVGRRYPHQQIPRKAWRSHQSHPTEALLDHEFLELLASQEGADNGCVTVSRHVTARPGVV